MNGIQRTKALPLFAFRVQYIGKFSREFNFHEVRDLPEISKYRHGKKHTLLYVSIECPWNSKNRTRWKYDTPSRRHFRQNFLIRKIPDIRYFILWHCPATWNVRIIVYKLKIHIQIQTAYSPVMRSKLDCYTQVPNNFTSKVRGI